MGASAVIVYEKNLFRTRAAFELLVITGNTDLETNVNCRNDCEESPFVRFNPTPKLWAEPSNEARCQR